MRARGALAVVSATFTVLFAVATACVPKYDFSGPPDADADGAVAPEEAAAPDGGSTKPRDAAADAPIDSTLAALDADATFDSGDSATAPDAAPSGPPSVVVGQAEFSGEACALFQGAYRCWGDDDCDGAGELGFVTDGGALVPPVPIPPSPNGAPNAFVLGGFHSCARYGRAVSCRGYPAALGSPVAVEAGVETPVVALPSAGVDLLAVGLNNTCAISFADAGLSGGLYCWGLNVYGECGRPLAAQDTTVQAYPVVITNDAGVGIATLDDVGVVGVGGQHACAATASGAVYCWGTTTFFESGPTTGPWCDDGARCDPNPQPIALSGTVQSFALGYDHTCAEMTSGDVYCWGSNVDGQLGVVTVSGACAEPYSDGGISDPCTSTPTLVPGLPKVQAISAGWHHTCAIDTNQEVWCWGHNGSNELGAGDSAAHTGPVLVLDPQTLAPIHADAVSAGGFKTCVHESSGPVLCWGGGELATETPDAAPPPADYPAPVLF